MNEEQFRNNLKEYLMQRRENDILFTETKFEGMSFADYHVSRLKRENDGEWNNEKAKERIGQLYSLGIRAEQKCEHCENVFAMHPGSNFCDSCQQYTFVPAIETSPGER